MEQVSFKKSINEAPKLNTIAQINTSTQNFPVTSFTSNMLRRWRNFQGQVQQKTPKKDQ